MKSEGKKTIFYSDELNDEFSTVELEHKPVSENYVYYKRNIFWKIGHTFWNRCVGAPIAMTHAKFKFGWKIVNKKAFKQANKTGYFIYGNHTQSFFDAAMPKIISNKDCYTIVNPDNLNVKGIGWLIKRLGALPLPNGVSDTKKFVRAIDEIIEDKLPILIYPEAHIWPYYTKIRPFKSTAFRYPVKYDVPSFCFVNTYQKRKNKVRIVTYIDGPFYPDKDLPIKERTEKLRNEVYKRMVELSANSNVEVIKYERRVDSD